MLLIPIMSGSAKSPAEGLKDSECERGVIITQPPIPYVAAVDPYKKAEKMEIKTRLPDGTNYQTGPLPLGNQQGLRESPYCNDTPHGTEGLREVG